jgi:hypothetical protein
MLPCPFLGIAADTTGEGRPSRCLSGLSNANAGMRFAVPVRAHTFPYRR